jgi:hypothetical protein
MAAAMGSGIFAARLAGASVNADSMAAAKTKV